MEAAVAIATRESPQDADAWTPRPTRRTMQAASLTKIRVWLDGITLLFDNVNFGFI